MTSAIRLSQREYEDFLRRPENLSRRFEIIGGEIIEKLPTQRQLLTLDEVLTGGDVLPDFSVAVRDLFPTG